MNSFADGFSAKLLEVLRNARRLAVLTGSGISAESGVPTFRDAQTGLWSKFRPEDLATPEAFQRNPKLVWEWYAWRRELVSQAQPNTGHLALVELEKRIPRFTLITQNVDGLHQRAGSRNVIELHGNITRTKCFEEDASVESWQETEPSAAALSALRRSSPARRGLVQRDAARGRHCPIHRRQPQLRRIFLHRHFDTGSSRRLAPIRGLATRGHRRGDQSGSDAVDRASASHLARSRWRSVACFAPGGLAG